MKTPGPRLFAQRRCGRWIGVCHIGSQEHSTIAGFDTRAEALEAAREVASRLNDAELGMVWWNRLTRLERAEWLTRADSAMPADAWEAFRREVARDDGQEVTRP